MWLERYRLDNPFARNHCVPLAMAHAAEMDSEWLRALANVARRTIWPATGRPLLSPSGRAQFSGFAMHQWCDLAGLRVEREWSIVQGYTLQRWARAHRRGRYIVEVRHHVVAVVNGVILGGYRPRSRVTRAAKVELKKPQY